MIEAGPYSYPIGHLGRVVVTDNSLSESESDRLAREIVKCWDQFRLVVEKEWQGRFPRAALAWATDEKVQIDPEPGPTPIIQFPYLEIQTARFAVRTRNHVTVCARGNNSKVWCRFGLIELEGRPASNLPMSEVAGFFEEFEDSARGVTESLAASYGEILRERKLTENWTLPFDIVAKAVNTSSPATSALIDDIRRNSGQALDLLGRLPETEPARQFVALVDLEPSQATRPDARLDDAEIYRQWAIHASPHVRSLYCIRVLANAVVYAGLSHSSIPSVDRAEGIKNLPATQSTRTLLRDLAAIY